MQITKYSDNSISFRFDNLEVELHYPLVVLSLTDITFKLNTEISYYKLDLVHIDYIFTFILLGFGLAITYSVKNY